MQPWTLKTNSYFDGETQHDKGPYFLCVEGGIFTAIIQGDGAAEIGFAAKNPMEETTFVMPGLVEAHAHLFLDGAVTDFTTRTAQLKANTPTMMATARRNLANSLASGITLIRDAGDRFGINHAIRDEVNASSKAPQVRSAGRGLHRAKSYGKFLARPVGQADDIRSAVAEIAKTSDDLKIILTGIIDFEAGKVTAPTQFTLDELRLITETAREFSLKTLAHCSGIDGIRLAVEAGVNSIEHGFFIDRDELLKMADKEIAWVPTISPVHFQWANPELAGWSQQTISNLRQILDDHFGHIAMTVETGTPLVSGSDAGSPGVVHGKALLDELLFLAKTGLPMTQILKSATSTPRKLWGVSSPKLAIGTEAECVALNTNPFDDPGALRDISLVMRRGKIQHCSIQF